MSDNEEYNSSDETPVTFLRSDGEICNISHCEQCLKAACGENYDDDGIEADTECTCEPPQYGDILCEEDGYRATNAYIYTSEGWECLSHLGPGQGSGGVPRHVSRFIENPVTFFNDEAFCAGDIDLVYLDGYAHSDLLKRTTGGRAVHPKLTVTYGLFSQNGLVLTTKKCLDGSRREIELDASIGDMYISGQDITEEDPILIKEQKELLENYNTKFKDLVKPGNRVSYRLVTEHCYHGGSMTVLSVETDDAGVVCKITTEDKYHMGLADLRETKWVFRPVIEPYRSIPRWTCLKRDDRVWKGVLTLDIDYSLSNSD